MGASQRFSTSFPQVAVPAAVLQAPSCPDSQSGSGLPYRSRAANVWPQHSCVLGQYSPGEGYRGTSLLQEEREQLDLQVCPFLCCSDHPNDHPWNCCGFGGDRSINPAGRGPSVRSLDPTKAFSCHKRLQVPAAQEPYLPWVSSILLSVCLFSGCQEGRMSRTFEILETLLGCGSIISDPTRAGP